ncbi:hypothetical protein CC2G_004036 [Coprinopsis cinerea AmutBmut pab1-1]|nr:hypothetical protein CC2G_004036 [Coprinopsis cinerea AmutBmut pab1-1]
MVLIVELPGIKGVRRNALLIAGAEKKPGSLPNPTLQALATPSFAHYVTFLVRLTNRSLKKKKTTKYKEPKKTQKTSTSTAVTLNYDTKLNDWFNCENQPCPNYPEDPRHQPSKQELSEVSFEEEPSAEFQDAQEEPNTEPQHQDEGPLIPECEEEEPFMPITLEQPVTMVNPTNPDNGTRDIVMSDETNQKIPER